MTSTRKAGLTVSLLFIMPLVLVAWILIAARDERPNAPVVAAPSQSIQEAWEPQPCPQCYDGESDWQDQKRDEQRARDHAAYEADQQLDERIADAARAAANAAVDEKMNETRAYPGY